MYKNLQKSPSRLRGIIYYLRGVAVGLPRLVNLEITKKCNARCSFCACWQAGSSKEIEDYGPIIKKFRPILLSMSGGEPLMRKDYASVVRSVRPYCHYLILITNGLLLNEDSAAKLANEGVNQICVSLDYLGKQHDEVRQIDGLYDHISKMIPLLTSKGFRIAINTIIMESNLDQIIEIAHRAKQWGAMISFSAFCTLKKDTGSEMVTDERKSHLKKVVDEILRLKSELKNIKNSDYYLKRIPIYFEQGFIPGCKAGYNWLQVTPDGYIQQCSESPRLCHYTEFTRKGLKPVACSKCWYTCRGEAQAPPLEPKRLMEFIRS